MKKGVLIIILVGIFCVGMSLHTSGAASPKATPIKCSYKGIGLESEDPRLFTYDDTVGLNVGFIDSLLVEISNRSPINEVFAGNIGVIERYPQALQLKSDEFAVYYLAKSLSNFKATDTVPCIYAVSKYDLERLVPHFRAHSNIDNADIVDFINIQKKIDVDMMYFLYDHSATDSLECEQQKIIDKYKFGTVCHEPCCKGYSIMQDTTIDNREKIKRLESCVSHLGYLGRMYNTSMFYKQISRFKQNIDSLKLVEKNDR